jgi:fucose 4-O-acetylase-like acetyltransferase
LRSFSTIFLGGVFIICGLAATAGVEFSFSMKDANFGPPLLGILLAMALSLGLILIMMKLQNWQPTHWLIPIGRASLVILFVHQFVHFTLVEIGVTQDAALILASLIIPLGLFFAMDRFGLSRWLFLGKGRPLARKDHLPTPA